MLTPFEDINKYYTKQWKHVHQERQEIYDRIPIRFTDLNGNQTYINRINIRIAFTANPSSSAAWFQMYLSQRTDPNNNIMFFPAGNNLTLPASEQEKGNMYVAEFYIERFRPLNKNANYASKDGGWHYRWSTQYPSRYKVDSLGNYILDSNGEKIENFDYEIPPSQYWIIPRMFDSEKAAGGQNNEARSFGMLITDNIEKISLDLWYEPVPVV